MRGEIKLKDYFQLGNHSSQNTLVVDEDGEETLAMSLNEFTVESRSDSNTDKVVSGIEEFTHGVLSRRSAKFFDLSNPEAYSAKPTKLNFVMGSEGFLSNVMNFIKETIEKLVRFIMGGVNWLIEKGKSLLGLSMNTARQQKQAADIATTRKDLEKYLKHLGFPETIMNLDNFIENLNPKYQEAFKDIAVDNKHVLTHFLTLVETQDELMELQREMIANEINVAKAQNAIKFDIEKLFYTLHKGESINTHQFQDLVVKINEGILKLNYKRYYNRMKRIIERHYKVTSDDSEKVENAEYVVGMNSIATMLTEIKAKLTKADPKLLAKTAADVIGKVAGARRNAPSRQVPGLRPDVAKLITLSKDKKEADMLGVIENAVSPGGNTAVNMYLGYLAEVAKYVTLNKEISDMITTTLQEQKTFYTFYCKLNLAVMEFLTKGLDAFIDHINNGNEGKPHDQQFESTCKGLFSSDETASDFISKMNRVFSNIHENGDLTGVKSKLANFKRQMEF